MKIAIVGSRNYPRLSDVNEAVKLLPKDCIVLSGGARGVDNEAERCATRRGLEVVIYRPKYAEHGRMAPLIRNDIIAKECDEMIAFWDGKSRGTLHVMNRAKALGKTVRLFEATK